jgi:hypothetical protein
MGLPADRAAGDTVDTTPPNPFDIVADAGDYQAGYSIASPWTSVSVSWFLTTDDTSSVVYEMAVDGVAQRIVESDNTYQTMSKHVDVPDGPHVIQITALDDAGNRQPANQTVDVVVDKITPVFTSFPLLLLRTGQVSMDAIPVRYTWTATDEGTGLAQVRVGYGHTCCFSVSPTSTRFDFTVAQGSLRNWRVFIEDGVGRVERVTRQVVVEPVAPKQITRVGHWRSRAVEGAIGGDERVSSKAGDRLALKVTGRSVAWVTSKGPQRGRADVYVDGKKVATVDLFAETLSPSRSVWATKLGLERAHRITIVNRSPKSRTAVGLDTILLQG